MSDLQSFTQCISAKKTKVPDKAVSFLYYRNQMSDIPEASASEIRDDFKSAGLPVPSTARIKDYLSKSKFTTKVGTRKWRIRTDKLDEVSLLFEECLKNVPHKTIETDSVIPTVLGESLPKYAQEVIRQINGCYDHTFFDSASVMIRRIVETLLIEVFEKKKMQSKIQDSDGNYLMLNGLINKTLQEPSMILGRNAKKGLNNAKWLGDQSAHNRRFIAKRADIDRVQPDIRILVQELATILSE